jgi:L-rhamnose 1-dehydrogenase
VGAYGLTQAVAEQLISQGYGGSVVSIASVAATMGATRLTHYSASKAAVLGMTHSIAVELGPHGVRVNTVSPGTTQTSLNAADLTGPKREMMEQKIPLRRLAVPEDIAKPVIFLLSDMSKYVSGQNLLVDGAATLFYE